MTLQPQGFRGPQSGPSDKLGGLLLTGNTYERLTCVLGMPFVLNGIVLTGSRGAFVVILCAGAMLALMKPMDYKKSFSTLAAFGLVLFAMLASQIFWQRLGTITVAVDDPAAMDTSAERRCVIAAAPWKMRRRYPFGSSHRGTAVLSPQYLADKYLTGTGDPDVQRARSSHNTCMTALSEQGFIGAFMLLVLWRWCAKTSLHLRRYTCKVSDARCGVDIAGSAATLMAIVIAGLCVDSLQAAVPVWMIALLASAAAMVMRKPVIEAQPALSTNDRPAARALRSGGQSR